MAPKIKELKELLAADGFEIIPDEFYPLWATKEIETICGPRAFSIIVFREGGKIAPNYFSEGGNILEMVSFEFAPSYGEALMECRERIEQSYARNLFNLFNQNKNGSI